MMKKRSVEAKYTKKAKINQIKILKSSNFLFLLLNKSMKLNLKVILFWKTTSSEPSSFKSSLWNICPTTI